MQNRVFLSSTWNDLEPYRANVREGLDRLRHLGFDIQWLGMEAFPASGHDDSLTVALSVLDTCDVFIGVLGPSYGSIVPGGVTSYVEAEYERACGLGLPRVLFLMNEGCDEWATLDDETDPGRIERRRSLRLRFKADRHMNYFESPADLALKVVLSVMPELIAQRDAAIGTHFHNLFQPSSPATDLVLVAESATILGDGSEKSTITARLTDAYGAEVENEPILWTATNDSTVNPRYTTTKHGNASTVLTPLVGGPERVIVNCFAVRSGLQRQISVEIVPPGAG